MELSTRLSELLVTSIEDYVKTAIPIASGALAATKTSDGKTKSPATIRNELKTLEEMGYLHQVHTSGGRVPTAQGYRYYVNWTMSRLDATVGELEQATDQISARVIGLPSIIDEICHKLEQAVDEVGIDTMQQQFDKLIVTDIIVIPLIAGSVMVVIKTNLGSITQDIDVESALSEICCIDAAAAMRTKCVGLTLRAMLETLPKIAKELKQSLAFFESLCRKLSEQLEQAIERDLTRRMSVLKLLAGDNVEIVDDDEGAIKFDYKVGDASIASIGITGPERMDYKNLVAALYTLVSEVEGNRKLKGGNNDQKRIK